MKKLSYKNYGLAIYQDGKQEWAYAPTDAAADRAANIYILDSVWSFKADFLLDYMPKGMTVDAILAIQTKFEDANEPLLSLIGSRKAKFVKDAIAADGRGHFLSPYDGHEEDSSRVDGLPEKGYAYRLN